MRLKAIRDAIYHKCLVSLPDGYKTRMLSDLLRIVPEINRRCVFIDLARAINVSRATIEGQYGEITGLLGDSAIFPTYIVSGAWSENINRAFIEFFKDRNGGTFLDIGANIGLTTIPVARNPKIECHAIEPEPINFELLQENVRRSLCSNVCLHKVAVFSDKTQLAFELDSENFGDHRVRVGNLDPVSGAFGEGRRRTIVVNGAQLDHILDADHLQRPIAAKIDVEGAEYHLYKGGRTILQAADLVIMEYWPYAINRLGGNIPELISMLEDDFPCASFITGDQAIDIKGAGPFGEIKEQLATRAKTAEPNEYTDLILTKHC